VELDGRRRADVRIAGGRITGIGARLDRRAGEEVLDGGGGALLPGLCDNHLHLYAMAAALRSVPCGPPEVRRAEELAAALALAPADEYGWVRGVGYSEDVAGPLDSAVLDRLHAARPVRVQHRSGALWTVNTAGARALGLAEAAHPGVEGATGRLWRADDWLRARLPGTGTPDLGPVGILLARYGITHVTDATPDLDGPAVEAIAGAVRGGALPQRVRLMGLALDRAAPDGVAAGPYKIVLADSGLPGVDELAGRIGAAHAAGRAVAVHCVTREALVLLLVAFEEAGVRPGDRVEHAALVPAGLVPRLRGLTVVTQPGFLAQRGDDYLRDVPAGDLDDLYRLRSLLDGGVACALSSDAPYGPADPWAVIASAAHRRTPAGRIAGARERLAPQRALAGYLNGPEDPGGAPRTVTRGAPADLVLLRAPREEALAAPDAGLVAATITAGKVAWHA
jgi:predicted amidohydrolase YtcJ